LCSQMEAPPQSLHPRGHLHLRAQPREEQVQGLRGRLHLRAQPNEGPMQGLRGRLHLRAQPTEE